MQEVQSVAIVQGGFTMKFVRQKIFSMVIVMAVVMGILFPAPIVNAASGDTTVYITKSGEKYHSDGCSSLKKSKISIALKDAVAKGYSPCSKCNPASLDSTSGSESTKAATSKTSTTSSSNTTATKESAEVEALKSYKGNTKDFNAYDYYKNNSDLQSAIGADGEALLKHYQDYGKKEGRIAIVAAAATAATTTTKSSKSSSSSGYGFDTYNIPEQQDTEDTYVLNTSTLKIHHPTCKDVPKIKPANYATSSSSTAELMAQGYTLCGHCFK